MIKLLIILISFNLIAETELTIVGAPKNIGLKELPASATIITDKDIKDKSLNNFQNLIDFVPNLNFAGGTSRPKFFQIRGIGELEQYEGTPNPSVGFLIDDIDFSGLGVTSNLFDIRQVEVVKGPSSTRFGANALAGVINLTSEDADAESKIKLSAGNFEQNEFGFASGGSINDSKNLFLRISGYRYYDNGFRKNLYLNSNDTNKREENSFKIKLKWLTTNKLTTDLTLMKINSNNGYDAFTIDNSFNTQSDQPGKDLQDSNSLALKFSYDLKDNIIQSITTNSNFDNLYSYDGDWGNNKFWEPYAPYDYFSKTFRSRNTTTQEIRFLSNDRNYIHGENFSHVLGLYFRDLAETSSIKQFQDKLAYSELDSKFKAKNYAIYGQLEIPITTGTSITAGARAEKMQSDFIDSRNFNLDPNYNLFAGNLSLNHDLNPNLRSYFTISKGFKPGGFNSNPNLNKDFTEYSPEKLINYEAGIKGEFLNQKLLTNFSAFYAQRKDVQVKLALQNDPNDPLSFTYLTDNAAVGKNVGVESETKYFFTNKFNIQMNLGLLDTKFNNYTYNDKQLTGRQQSHAPNWQYSITPEYLFKKHYYFNTSLIGKDSFYFDDSHDQKSSVYSIVNLNLGYRRQTWDCVLYLKNVFNNNYATRGFFFGNEPPNFENKEYVQLGDPRQIGIGFNYRF